MEIQFLYLDIEVTKEEEDDMIRNIAKKIHQSGMDVAAIILIESMKPLSFIGNQMGRAFLSPFLPIFGEDIGLKGDMFFQIFEKRDNMEKLIKAVEELTREEEAQKNVEKAKKLDGKSSETETLETSNNKGWRRFLPF